MTNHDKLRTELEPLVGRLRENAADMAENGFPFYARPLTEAADTIQSLLTTIEGLTEALKPFADCADQINPEEDDEEWAKFRLLVQDYRHARKVLSQ